jgi:methyl coenzyme M reductase beta subunit
MRLVDMEHGWYGSGGPGITDANGNPVPARKGLGLFCECPCQECDNWMALLFHNPLDGGTPLHEPDRDKWTRTGDTFETLTLSPSIFRNPAKGGCGWHGYLENGVFRSC